MAGITNDTSPTVRTRVTSTADDHSHHSRRSIRRMPNRIGGTLSLPGSLDIGFLDIGRHLPCQHFQCTTGSVTLYALQLRIRSMTMAYEPVQGHARFVSWELSRCQTY